MVKSLWWWGGVGGPCDYCVTPVPIGLGFWTALGLGLRGPDLGLGLDNNTLKFVCLSPVMLLDNVDISLV